ncbi:TetR/AcrR family transcriptional regulator [Amycolatopsis sp. A133]|jgi:AcrR family transcriptional regulator|uniref:TetR/AcrR family transcriptional regulator n=1 Tax=Amycolatopsis sp. A133 TaxID=3064472 RepID=UPI0027F2EBE1|nr:TetR/AcrR family transcriptional regulator [Amycolatopsis sp. A133]MDQ7806389.1 TetR/AcrR family transcriptional regulator [Amycolatopsis sp. A133]
MPAANPPRARSGNRRDEAARLAVLHAAEDLLAEHGFAALTVEAIARRAGVAKQTIYRWWPSKVEILLDSLIEDSAGCLPVPDAPTADAIHGYLRAFARFLNGNPAGQVLLALLAQAQHDAATATSFHERYLGPRRAQERELVARAIEAGEIAPRLRIDAALDAVLGPLVYGALTGAVVSRDAVDTLFEELLRPRV